MNSENRFLDPGLLVGQRVPTVRNPRPRTRSFSSGLGDNPDCELGLSRTLDDLAAISEITRAITEFGPLQVTSFDSSRREVGATDLLLSRPLFPFSLAIGRFPNDCLSRLPWEPFPLVPSLPCTSEQTRGSWASDHFVLLSFLLILVFYVRLLLCPRSGLNYFLVFLVICRFPSPLTFLLDPQLPVAPTWC